jgi:hypothetical protein
LLKVHCLRDARINLRWIMLYSSYRVGERITRCERTGQVFIIDGQEVNMPEPVVVNVPPRLFAQLETLVKEGWYTDVDSLVVEALRRYLEAHNLDLSEQFIRQDVDWGLHGNE